MNAKNFSDRLDFAISKVGNIGDIVRSINISYTTISRWKEGADPKVSNMVALAEIAGVNLDWLLTGKGTPNGTTDAPAICQPVDDDYDYVPYADDVFASAGGGRFNDGVVGTDRYLAFRKDWVRANGFNAKDLVAINTDGDSMLPTIPENATVLVDKSKNVAKDGRIYVVRIDDQLYVKRIQWLPKGLKLISDNKDIYGAIELSKADLADSHIQIYGQVVHISYDLPH